MEVLLARPPLYFERWISAGMIVCLFYCYEGKPCAWRIYWSYKLPYKLMAGNRREVPARKLAGKKKKEPDPSKNDQEYVRAF